MASPYSTLIFDKSVVKPGELIQFTAKLFDPDGDLKSFGVRWQGHGLIDVPGANDGFPGSFSIAGGAAEWRWGITAGSSGSELLRIEVHDNANNHVAGEWQEVKIVGSSSAVDINVLDPTKAGQTGSVLDPRVNGTTVVDSSYVGAGTIYTNTTPVIPPTTGTQPTTPSTNLSTLTVAQWLVQRPDIANNWTNANSAQFANDPQSIEIRRFGTLDNYARWTALMDGAGQAGNAPSTAALELYLETRPDLRVNWQTAQADPGSTDPLIASILSYGSLGSYARAAAQANPGAPAAGNQTTTGSNGSSGQNDLLNREGVIPTAATTVTAGPDLLKLAIPAATIFAAFFR